MWLQLFSSLRRLYEESASTSLLPLSTIWLASLLLLVRLWTEILAYCTIFKSIVISIMPLVYEILEKLTYFCWFDSHLSIKIRGRKNTCTLHFNMGSFFRHLCTSGPLPQTLDGISSYGLVFCVRGPLFLVTEDVRQFFIVSSFIYLDSIKHCSYIMKLYTYTKNIYTVDLYILYCRNWNIWKH